MEPAIELNASFVAATAIAFLVWSESIASVVTPLPLTVTSLSSSLNSKIALSASAPAVLFSEIRSVSVFAPPSDTTVLRPEKERLDAPIVAFARCVSPSNSAAAWIAEDQPATSFAAPCVIVRAVIVPSPRPTDGLLNVTCHACAPSLVLATDASFSSDEIVVDSPSADAIVMSLTPTTVCAPPAVVGPPVSFPAA